MKVNFGFCRKYMFTVICLTVLMTGCGRTNAVPGAQPIGRPGAVEENPTYEALVVEKSDLFDKSDMDSEPDLSSAIYVAAADNQRYVVDGEGTYVLSGEAQNFTVIVAADKDDEVQIVLDAVTVTNDDFPVVFVKSAAKCFVTSMGDNALSVRDEYTSAGDTNTDAVIFSKSDLTLNGTGKLAIVSSCGNGITGKDDLKITGGSYDITCELDGIEAHDSISVYNGEFVIDTNKDAFHCENKQQQGAIYIKDGLFDINADSDGIQATTYLVIDGGEYTINASEGLEATYVQINGGKIKINASDDGINASDKSTEYDVVIEINDGELEIVMGQGDTDGLDANGVIVVNGGCISVSGVSTFDYDRGAIYNGGTIIINGVETNEIPTPTMGGPGGPGGPDGNGGYKRPERPDGFGGPGRPDESGAKEQNDKK